MTSGGSPAAGGRSGTEAVGLRVALVQSRFHAEITNALVEGAIRALAAHGAHASDVATVQVPGAWELPQAAARVIASGRFNALVALGCVVRGETPHFEYVCMEATLGLGAVARSSTIPVAFGVLTTDTVEQARARAGGGPENKGYEAAMAVLDMVAVYRRLGAP